MLGLLTLALANVTLATGSAASPKGFWVEAAPGGCPDEAALRQAFEEVGLPAAGGARVEVEGDQLVVVFFGSDGGEVGRRVVPAPPTCAQRARVAAVLLGAWHPRLPLPPPAEALAGPAAEALAVPAAAPKDAALARPAAPSAPPASPSASRPASTARPSAAPAEGPPRTSGSLGFGVGLLSDGEALGYGALLEGALSRGAWGARLGLTLPTERRFSFAGGDAAVRRWAAEIGPRVERGNERWAAALDLGLRAAWHSMRGARYVDARQAGAFDFGGALTARVGPRRSWSWFWLFASAAAYATRQEIRVAPGMDSGGGGAQRAVPRWEAMAGAGASFGRGVTPAAGGRRW